jgi:WD repeat-containing protein 19
VAQTPLSRGICDWRLRDGELSDGVSLHTQELGNYKLAHSQLLETCRELTAQNKRVPAELSRQLLLLHSYVLVKTLVKFNDHAAAARMLVRVAKSISKFPRHIVPILTSTVIECQRSGLKSTAFEYASMLMRPEYRKGISEQYRAKIEKIVRKPEKVRIAHVRVHPIIIIIIIIITAALFPREQSAPS